MRSYVLLLICLAACTTRTEQTTITDSIEVGFIERTPVNVKKNTWDTLYVSMNNDGIVFGDSASGEISYMATKFEPHIRFTDFPVKMAITNFAPPDFNSHPLGREFRTRIKTALKEEGINFGGHYCLVIWGCGSPCQMSVLVDVLTGKIYASEGASLGYDFRKDSRMLIVNPVSEEADMYSPKPGYYLDCPYCKPQVYVWNEQLKKFEQR